jgi:NRE family putative nickel resistance protein-like MFS transporter
VTYGTRVLLREPSLRQAVTLSFAEATAGAAAIVVTVVYVRDVIHRSNSAVAFAMACVGGGSALVAVALAQVTGRYESGIRGAAALHGVRHRWAQRAMLVGGAVLGLCLLPGALVPAFLAFCLLWTLNGAGQALIAMPSSTLLAEHTQEDERGRAYAAHFALTHFFWLVAYPAVGHAAVRWGAPATFTAAGAVCLLVTMISAQVGAGKQEAHTHAPA